MPVAKNPARAVGPATEIWIYRYDLEAKNRGSRRDLLFNATASSGVENALHRLFGAGRFRLEWRDAKRWIVRVKVVEIDTKGRVVERKRAPAKRVVGPPAAALPRSHVGKPPLIARSDPHTSFLGSVPALIGPPTNVRHAAKLKHWYRHVASVITGLAKSIEREGAIVGRKTSGQEAEKLAGYLRDARKAREEYVTIPASLAPTGSVRELRAQCELLHSRADGKIKRLKAIAAAIDAWQRA